MNKTEGTILRIERISPDDGTGLRTVIFLKGCPLKCAWCSTPESQRKEPEWCYIQSKCRQCGYCVKRCKQKALSFSKDGSAIIRDKDKCINCLECAKVCLTKAISIFGKRMTVDQIMKEINKDRLFYFYSKGGITLSGGDILLQADFASELLKEARENMLNTTAEMDFFGNYNNVKKILPYLNSYFVDLKHMDSKEHMKWTGVGNESILANILKASQEYPYIPMNARIPLIPGVNDSKENIKKTVEFCCQIKNCKSLEILPFHSLGEVKYIYTGRPYYFKDMRSLVLEDAIEKVKFLKDMNLLFKVKVQGKVIYEK